MVTGLKSIVLLGIFFLVATNPVVSQKLGSLKNKYTYVGIPDRDFNEIAIYGKQRNMNWCWAACVQMVLNFHHIPVEQEDVVEKTLGSLIDKPADPDMMFKALNGWEVDLYGNDVIVNSNFYTTSAYEITAFLSTKKPLIIGLAQPNTSIGHAYVLIGIYYIKSKSPLGDALYSPHSVILVDPWPDNESFIDMSWDEFTDRFIVSYKVWVN